MNIALIPARAGSKRIPGKNVRDFCGAPMITHPIRAALASGCFARVIVSTDSQDIARIAREAGAEVPFLRPAELSDDLTGTAPVVRHAISELGLSAHGDDALCCIYATAPFVRAEDLAAGLAALRARDADFAFAVGRFAAPIQRALCIDQHGLLSMFDATQYTQRSQDLESAYHDAGQFYWGTVQAWLRSGQPYEQSVVPVLLPPYRVQDIDTLEDWRRAELMFRALQKQESTQ